MDETLDKTLKERYEALLYGYDSGGTGLIAELKQNILERPGLFRPDAALCLLVLFDQMIVRPYSGKIFLFKGNGEALALPTVGTVNFDQNVRTSFQKIMKSLENNGSAEPRSSHEVLKAIDAIWKELSDLLGWA